MLKTPRAILLLVPFALAAAGCTTLPDVKPFADSTAALAVAAGTHYHDVETDVASLRLTQSAVETNEAFALRKQALEADQQTFKQTGERLDALFDAMTMYSEKVASLAAAGKTGPEAAQSLLESAKGFGELAGIAAPAAGGAVDAFTKAFKAIADEFTKMQAKKSLKEAVAAAQPGVDMVATQFEVIYGTALPAASSSIRKTKESQASIAAGGSIIGFSDNVKRNYNAYYRSLNAFVTPIDPHSTTLESAWRGFCTEPKGPCRAKNELEAVGLVEARMVAIRPIVDAYQSQVVSLDATLARRQNTSRAVIKAVKAWALEHRKLRQSLEDGTSLSAFNLKAAIVELEGLLGQKP